MPFTDQPRPNEVDFRNVGAILLFSGLVLAVGGLQALARFAHPAAPVALGLAWLAALPRVWRGLDRLKLADDARPRTARRR